MTTPDDDTPADTPIAAPPAPPSPTATDPAARNAYWELQADAVVADASRFGLTFAVTQALQNAYYTGLHQGIHNFHEMLRSVKS